MRPTTLALRVTLVALTVGGAVAAMAASYGAGGCSGPTGGGPGDAVCHQLVRSLAERVGLVSALATAVVVLTMIGLARTPVIRRLAGPRGGLGE